MSRRHPHKWRGGPGEEWCVRCGADMGMDRSIGSQDCFGSPSYRPEPRTTEEIEQHE